MKTSVCVVAPHATAGFFIPSGLPKPRFGGAEWQAFTIAQSLKTHADLHFIVENFPGLVSTHIPGINVHIVRNRKSGLRYVRYIHPGITDLWKMMKQADADIYYQRGPLPITGIVGAFCKRFRKKFVYAMANDNEITNDWSSFTFKFEQYMYEIGYKSADHILTQNSFQKSGIKKKYHKNVSTILNIYPGPFLRKKPQGEYILTVANILPKKQIHLVLDAARSCPQLKFRIIGSGEGAYFEKIKKEAEQISNVEMIGKVQREFLFEHYVHALCLLQTSIAEGFPNTFLEAWAHQVPVLSLNIDPDNVIKRFELGWVARNLNEIISHLNFVSENPVKVRQKGKSAISHVISAHNQNNIAAEYLNIFTSLLEN